MQTPATLSQNKSNQPNVYRKLQPTLLSTPAGAAFVNLSADMKIGSEIIGSNSSLSSQSEGVCAVGTPEPSSSTTTESTAGHSNKHMGYKWIHKHLRPHTHTQSHTYCLTHTHTHTTVSSTISYTTRKTNKASRVPQHTQKIPSQPTVVILTCHTHLVFKSYILETKSVKFIRVT